MIHCNGEPGTFPESEFLQKDGEIVRPYIHLTDTPHYASNGRPAPVPVPKHKHKENGTPVPPGAEPK